MDNEAGNFSPLGLSARSRVPNYYLKGCYTSGNKVRSQLCLAFMVLYECKTQR